MTSSESSNIFNILGLSIDVGPEQVRKRCQDLLLKLHPDKNGGVETPEYHKIASVWKQISMESDFVSFLNREKAKARSVAASAGAMTCSSDVRLSDMRREVVDIDGSDVESFLFDCRCGGLFLLTVDTVEETSLRNVESWNVECETCSLLLRVVNK